MDGRKTVWKRKANGAFGNEKKRKQWRFQQVLHYISAAMLSDVLGKRAMFISCHLWLCVAAQCTAHTHTCQFVSLRSVRASESRDVVYFISLLHTLEQFIIEFTLSLQWISQNNELRGKINILNKKWKWNATMHNDFFESHRSRRLTLNYFILLENYRRT